MICQKKDVSKHIKQILKTNVNRYLFLIRNKGVAKGVLWQREPVIGPFINLDLKFLSRINFPEIQSQIHPWLFPCKDWLKREISFQDTVT